MQKSLFIKISIVFVLCGLFAIGLSVVNGIIAERKNYYHDVMSDIKQTHVKDQFVTTPFVAIANAQGIYIPAYANKTDIQAQANVTDKDYQRSIYQAISYQNSFNISQSYDLKAFNQIAPFIQKTESGYTLISSENPPQPATDNKTNTTPSPRFYQWQTAKLIVPISDLRGVTLPKVSVNGKAVTAQFPKQKEFSNFDYIEINLNNLFNDNNIRSATLNQPLDIKIDLTLTGIESLGILPLGDNFAFNLQANWTEPKFFGDALPTKTFSPTGFTASWQNQFLATHNNQKMSNCLYLNGEMGSCQILPNISDYTSISDFKWLNTAFINTNNIYTQTDRTLKYALLLVVVSFGTFFLFEVLKNLRIHPIQYGLVAIALLIFYVLLLSFAEHMLFWQAYSIASFACVGLIGWYTFFVLKSLQRSLVFASILAGLYAGFYLILTSEAMNLLLGAVFCFVLLATVMFLTRHIDWYQISENQQLKQGDNP